MTNNNKNNKYILNFYTKYILILIIIDSYFNDPSDEFTKSANQGIDCEVPWR